MVSRRAVGLIVGAVVSAVALAACGSGSPATTTTTTLPTSPSVSFSTATVSGVGTVLVDGDGRTVYELSSASTVNLPCTDASGCTSVWTPLPLPAGTSSATAHGGVIPSLLSTTTMGGHTYPTYNGYVLYEYTGDAGPGQANGEGIQSNGGTWMVLSSSGSPVGPSDSSATSTTTTYGY